MNASDEQRLDFVGKIQPTFCPGARRTMLYWQRFLLTGIFIWPFSKKGTTQESVRKRYVLYVLASSSPTPHPPIYTQTDTPMLTALSSWCWNMLTILNSMLISPWNGLVKNSVSIQLEAITRLAQNGTAELHIRKGGGGSILFVL